ncbi:MAG: SseB family protein [Actinomycetota bacterium]|nr:SseB family protein [Actinomycetota bacterium]
MEHGDGLEPPAMTNQPEPPATMNEPGHGRRLVSPGRFTADDGSTDPDICAALSAPVDPKRLRDAVREGRLIVAIVASPTDTGESGGSGASGGYGGSQMSVVLMVAADGRRGLLAFTGLDAMHRWNPHARPVPVSGPEVAQAALDDGCEAVVIDVAGPSSAVVAEPDLVELANRDPLDHAAALLSEVWASESGEASVPDVSVDASSGTVRVTLPTQRADEYARSIPARVLALVPAGIEIITADE